MNLTVTPMASIRALPSFKGYSGDWNDDNDYESDYSDNDYKVDYSTYKDDLKRAETKGFNEGLISGALGMTIIAVLAGASDSKTNSKNTDRFINTLSEVAISKDIKQDTFSVKDINKDEHPDLILYKKDGSKVVIDIKNQQVIQDTKKLDVIK